MSPAPTRSELLESEKGLMRPAGIAAIAGVILFVASAFIQSSVGGQGVDTDAKLLAQYGEDGNTLLLGRIVFGLAFLCFTLPLYTLFRAIQARTDRVRNHFVAFCFIGPLLLAVQAPLLAVGYIDAGEKYLQQAPALESEAQAQDQEAGEGQQAAHGQGAADQGKRADGQEGKQADAEAGKGDGQAEADAATTEATTTEDSGKPDEDDTPQENLAEDLIEDSGTIAFAQPLLLPALLAMVTAMVYINLWALRVGLLTRFWGSFGIALGVAMIIILPLALLGLVIWFLSLGMLLLGSGRRARTPAWEAGRPMPWAKPGEEPPPPGPAGEAPAGEIEGSGRELEVPAPDGPVPAPDARPPDAPDGPPPDGPAASGGEDGPPSENGAPPQKRKRRR